MRQAYVRSQIVSNLPSNSAGFQRVPEGKTVKNRVHLDISATPGRAPSREEVDAERDRIVALGASVLRVVDEMWGPFPEYHSIMADPEGNEFCIQ